MKIEQQEAPSGEINLQNLEKKDVHIFLSALIICAKSA